MVVYRRKKSRRLRGSKRHGYGIKKNRGAGNKGGRGMAGSGKRAGQKKPSILKEFGLSYFGKKGFTSIHRKRSKIINLNTLDLNITNYIKKGLIKEEKGAYHFDASAQGYTKVLANGKLAHKFIIKAPTFSKKAKEHIELAGGQALAEKENVPD